MTQIRQLLAQKGHCLWKIEASASIYEAAHEMNRHRIGALVVENNGQVVGIFTERDAAFRVLAIGLDADTTPVSEVMTHNPITLTEDRPFGHALHLMYENGVRHVPIVDANRRPLGVLTARDALQLDAIAFGAELVRREELTVIL